jgi:HEAT repeat protein
MNFKQKPGRGPKMRRHVTTPIPKSNSQFHNMISSFRTSICLLALSITLSGMAAPNAARNLRLEMGTPPGSTSFGPDLQKQRELLATIQSPTKGKNEKAFACKLLTIHGTEDAVPVLAPLLSDPQLASWARIALEAIPGGAADAALRDAMPRLDGLLLVGVINSVGERGDAKALSALAARLKDSDPEVASAAAVAMGKIGGSSAAKSLQAALKTATPATSDAIAEGCIRCAEQFLADNKAAQARKLYDAVRQARVPRNKVMEATRGAILARGNSGVPMLLGELRSTDKDRVSIGLRTARELPGRKTTEAVAAEVRRSPEERQPHLLLALADRRDPAALPTVVEAARTGSKPLQLVAVTVLERLGSLSSVPVLIEVATNPDRGLSQAAIGALTRLPADGMDADVLSRLTKASGREREVLIRVAGQRQIQEALTPILASGGDPDPGVRTAALQAVGNLGTEKQVPGLIQLLGRTTDARSRGEVENALLAIASRNQGTVAFVTPLARSSDPALRSFALQCFSASGGPEALAAVKLAVEDTDPDLQDEAVNVLAAWPNTWPEDSAVAEPLLVLARNGAKRSHQLLALRGYLRYIQGETKLKPEDKVAKVREVTTLMQRPEEKRLAVSVLGDVTAPAAVDLLLTMAEEEAVREDACSALLKLGSRGVSGLPRDQRQKALQAVIEKSKAENTRKRAEERLKSLE